jgi:hypothetical protein
MGSMNQQTLENKASLRVRALNVCTAFKIDTKSIAKSENSPTQWKYFESIGYIKGVFLSLGSAMKRHCQRDPVESKKEKT